MEGKKKEKFLKRLGKDLKLQVVFCVTSVVVLLLIYFPLAIMFNQENIKKNAIGSVSIADDIAFAGITEIEEKQQSLSISGWGIRLNSTLQDIYVVLEPENMEDANNMVLSTKLQQNSEVQEYTDYLYVDKTVGCGFNASVKTDALKKNVCYRIQVYMNYTQDKEDGSVKISTNQYLFNGELYSYNPLEFKMPLFKDERMKQVIEQGALMGYSIEQGAWVYFYKGSLYWVLDKNVAQNLNEELHIFFHLLCTNKEDLPENRKEYGFDNKDFVFKTNEIFMDDSVSYRVAVMPLEEEYKITYIRTGEYNAEMRKSIWNTRFYLLTEIEDK